MAIALRHRREARRLAATTAPLWLGVVALSLVGPALDLVGQLQHVAALQSPALLACAVATVAQAASLVHRPRAAWLMAAALATGTSVILRLGGYPEGPALALLGIVALGTGGAFGPAAATPDLVGQGEAPAPAIAPEVDTTASGLPKAA